VSQADSARDAFRSGDYANAAPLFEKAINSGEDSAENNQLLGTCYYHLGRKSEAVTRFERAINLYLDRKSRGEAVEAANAGINTCKQFIELSRE
jgi:Flp pilus assembly protein TadD